VAAGQALGSGWASLAVRLPLTPRQHERPAQDERVRGGVNRGLAEVVRNRNRAVAVSMFPDAGVEEVSFEK
jgi:hypothetical protein